MNMLAAWGKPPTLDPSEEWEYRYAGRERPDPESGEPQAIFEFHSA